MNSQAAPLSIDSLKAAFEALDWRKAKSLLDGAGGAEADWERVAWALRRSSALIFRHPAASKERRRGEMFSHLTTYLGSDGSREVPPAVSQAIETLLVAEQGYRKLLEALGQSDASKLSSSQHVAATLELGHRVLEGLLDTLAKQAAERDVVTPHIRVQGEDGGSFEPDAGLETIVTFVSTTIQMEAVKGGWYDGDGTVVVPRAAVSPAEGEVELTGSTLLLATLWKRWKLIEESARFLGGRLRILGDDEPPSNASSSTDQFLLHESALDAELLHRVAFERQHDMMSQNLLEIQADHGTQARVDATSKHTHLLPPQAVMSNDELHALWLLSRMLAYDVRVDREHVAGLRLVEWVRGYCALKQLSNGSARATIVKTKSGWQHYLADFALSADVAALLLDRLTFRRSSDDLFDQPFLKQSDGTYAMYTPSFASMNVAMVVLSVVGKLREQFQKKGKSFERTVRELFAVQGLEVYAFKATRDGAEYEYDVVVPWDDYLFVFECKNRSLPSGRPAQMHYFDLENESNVKQVKRLIGALEQYPDILTSNLPASALGKKVVPIVLNCLPYSAPGGIDGVYFYDFSALSRFFAGAQIHVRSVNGRFESEPVASLGRLWAGDAPSATDLMSQLDHPVQFTVVQQTLETHAEALPLPPNWRVLTTSLRRVEHPFLVGARDAAAQPELT